MCENDALRACSPTIWIPRDPLEISDDKISQTRESNKGILIVNDKARINLTRRVVVED